MRLSWPMPRRTSLMSAPIRSHRLAISLMKLIFVASMALATYLVISALSGDIDQERLLGAQERRVQLAEHARPTSGRRTPTTTRSGFMKSSIAAPSLRNSGLLATSNGAAGHLGQPAGELGVGADRHGALDDDDLGRVAGARRSARPTAQTPRQIGAAVVALRRADGDEDELGLGDRRRPGRW